MFTVQSCATAYEIETDILYTKLRYCIVLIINLYSNNYTCTT